MYPAVCINCNKDIVVPFEPKAGKPIYCKECLNKIKVGELKPAKGFYDKNSTDGPKPAEALAAMGIEYQPTLINTNKGHERPEFKKELNSSNKNIPKKFTPASNAINNTSYQTNNKPKIDLPPIKDSNDNKDNKEGFTSLKDLLNTISKPEENQKPTEIKSDPTKVTIHPKVIEAKKPEENLSKTKAASYESQQLLKSVIENTAVKQNPITSTPVNIPVSDPIVKKIEPVIIENKKEIQSVDTPIMNAPDKIIEPVKTYMDVIKEEKPILAVYTKIDDISKKENVKTEPDKNLNSKNNQNEDEVPIPKPPESYAKRTPQKEVPEDILKKLFEEDPDKNKQI
jgi:CxxC-x17-CxxC domain-containing protein